MKFYWISSTAGWGQAMGDRIMSFFDAVYAPIAHSCGLEFQYLDVRDLLVSVTEEGPGLFLDGENLLSADACAYVESLSPDREVEQRLETVHRLVYRSHWGLANRTECWPMAEKDKLFCLSEASRMGIPTVRTLLKDLRKGGPELAHDILSFCGGGPVAVKPKQLGAGFGVTKARGTTELQASLELLSLCDREFLFQEFIEIEAEYRAYCADGEVLAVLKRLPAPEAPRGKAAGGVRAVEGVLPDRVSQQSLRIAEVFGPGYICVDWLGTDGGRYYLSEVETGGAIEGLSAESRDRVGRAFFECARRRCSKRTA